MIFITFACLIALDRTTSTMLNKSGNGGHLLPCLKKKVFSLWKWKSFSHVQLFATPWTVACQTSLSMEFSRQEYWSRLPFPSPGDLPDPKIEPGSPALQADSLPSELLGFMSYYVYKHNTLWIPPYFSKLRLKVYIFVRSSLLLLSNHRHFSFYIPTAS